MNTAAACKHEDTAPLPTATRQRVVAFVMRAANDGTTAETTYDHAKRILTLVNRQGAAPVSSYSYRYDANGNRTQQIENVTGTDELTSYTYDDNDRLSSVAYPDKQTAYSFDANANRLTEVTTAGGAVTVNKTYTYNTRNQLTGIADSVTPANDAVYDFDANGNQIRKTQGGNVTDFSYDVKDQLIAVRQNAANTGVFAYDYQGHRIVKDMGGAIVRYAYDGNSVLVETDTSGTTVAKFDYGPDRLLSMNHITEGRAYYLFDALGSVANLVTSAGAIQARYQYDAFGNYRSTAGASFNRFAFTGHEKDNETNLYYFKARYYDPDTGRFLNQDAYLGDVNTPPSLHRYLYAYSNPLVYIDLNGYESISAMIDNAAEGCGAWSCAGWALAKGAYAAATFGFAAVHDPVRDMYDEGKITGKQYVEYGIGGGTVVAGSVFAGAVLTGTAAPAVGAAIQSVRAIGVTGTILANPVVATEATVATVETAAAVTSGTVTTSSIMATTEKAAAKAVVNESETVSETAANSTQAAKNLVATEGNKMATSGTVTPAAQRTVAAEVSQAPHQQTSTINEKISLSASDDATDLFAASRGHNLSKLTNQQVGDLGEDIAKTFLKDNGHTDIFSIQNRSGNGIDIVSRSSDGRLVFNEVKTSAKGNIGDLSKRQENMHEFVEDVLTQAARKEGRYRNIDDALQQRARQMLREFRQAPQDVSGNAIGVDLQNEILRVSPWKK